MYYIGICDDHEYYRDDIHKKCDRLFDEINKEYTCIKFSSGEEVLKYNGPRMHLLFLDIEMPGMKGIEVLHWLEKNDIVWKVIFITCHSEFVYDIFGFKTLTFLCKPVEYEQISMWGQMAVTEYELRTQIINDELNKAFQFNLLTGTCVIGLKDVVYMEGARNYCYLKRRTHQEKELLSGNLKLWENKLEDTSMLRVHKSILVNMFNVRSMQSGKVVMVTGEEFKIGRKYSKCANEVYAKFRKEYLMGR